MHVFTCLYFLLTAWPTRDLSSCQAGWQVRVSEVILEWPADYQPIFLDSTSQPVCLFGWLTYWQSICMSVRLLG